MSNLTRQGVKDAILASSMVAAERVVTLADGVKVPFRVWSAEAQTRLGSLFGKARASGDEPDQLGWDVVRTAVRLAVLDDQDRQVFESNDLVGRWLDTLSNIERGDVLEAAQWVLAEAGLADPPADPEHPEARESAGSLGNGSSVTTSG
jgi:hypothetical protein